MMTSWLRCLGLALLVGAVTGCATYPGYWTDRGRDAADVFTIAVGSGLGAKARVGPVNVGLCTGGDFLGMRGGDVDVFGRQGGSMCDFSEVNLLVMSTETFDPGAGSVPPARNKSYGAVGWGLVSLPEPATEDGPKPDSHLYTQIEVLVGLGVSVRVGFNPGELLDFLLGFAGVDIYGDDLEARAAATTPTSPDTAPK